MVEQTRRKIAPRAAVAPTIVPAAERLGWRDRLRPGVRIIVLAIEFI
jgi:hypothetical protein